MGGTSSSTQREKSQTKSEPWEPAQESMRGILDELNPQIRNSRLNGVQTGALDQLQQNVRGGNPFAGQITDFTNNLFGGGGANNQAGRVAGGYDAYNERLSPYANGSMVGNNPALQAQLDTIMSDVGNSINGQFAAAGRDFSGANQQAYGRGVAQGIAPVLANQYNTDVDRQLGAANALYGANNTTGGMLAGMDQQGLANQLQGVNTSADALEARNYAGNKTLEIEQLRKSLPAEALGLLAQIGIPIAGLGGQTQSSATRTGTQQMSGAQQFATIAGGIGNLFGAVTPKAPVKV